MDFDSKQKRLIHQLVSEGYIHTPPVVEAMSRVPRHLFVPPHIMESAYEDHPLPIGSDQTISAPHMVGIMTEALDVRRDSRVLEVGAGSGYQAAVLAEIARDGLIYSVERIPELVLLSIRNLRRCGYSNVSVVQGDGTLGYPKEAPYDRIIVTAGSPKVPDALVGQLAECGSLLIPVGGRFCQELLRVEKKGGGVVVSNLGGCVFVPLVGDDGW